MRVSALVLVLAALLAIPATGAAAPVSGAQFGRTTMQSPVSFFSAAGCAAFAPVPQEAPSALTATVDGWYGPSYGDDIPYEDVRLHATLHGTVTDAAGHTYVVSGEFAENSTRDLFADSEVVFRGTGTLKLAGAGGAVVGAAQLVVLTAPSEIDVALTNVAVCHPG